MPECFVGKSGCYAWDRKTMGDCPENPKQCKPWDQAGFIVEIVEENTSKPYFT